VLRLRLRGGSLNQKEKRFIHICNKYPDRKEGRNEEFAEGKRGREITSMMEKIIGSRRGAVYFEEVKNLLLQ
jgi:hypothetical protein